MFVIPCKYSSKSPFVISLVEDIRTYHPNEKIVVVDSNSEDKSYYEKIAPFNVIIEDIANTNWMIGAFWHAYKTYPSEKFYYFMHDSMRVKSNLDYLKDKELTLLCYFDRQVTSLFSAWADIINTKTKFTYNSQGLGCYGPLFFCQRKVMDSLFEAGVNNLLPNNKVDVGFAEGAYGFFFEQLGYNLEECSLYGNVLVNESRQGRSGGPPHNTSWQYPVEKFYGHFLDANRL